MTFFAKLPPRLVALEACGAWPAVMERRPKAEYMTLQSNRSSPVAEASQTPLAKRSPSIHDDLGSTDWQFVS